LTEGIVVDANIISSFIEEEKGEHKDVYFIITAIKNKYGFAINNIIEQEWRNTAGNEFFKYWFDDALIHEKIRYVSETKKLSKPEKKEIAQKYGFPLKGSRDIHYIICAINTDKRYIYTDDIHFFDPKQKTSDPTHQERIKKDRSGRFCRYLKNQFDITVGRTEHCPCDLGISLS
jgi:hypothetical protein